MSTTTDANKLLLRRLFDEVINGHNYAVIDQLFAPDYEKMRDFVPVKNFSIVALSEANLTSSVTLRERRPAGAAAGR